MTTLKEEEPYAAVVDKEYLSLTCSKCFAWNLVGMKRVKLRLCGGCGVVHYCGTKCQTEDWQDHKAECKLLRSADFLPSKDARLVMRMIEKSRKQPDLKAYNGRTYDSLMHHSEKRRENANCMAEAMTIYDEIRRCMGSQAPDFETVFLALSKKTINAFPMHDGSWNPGLRGIGIYLGLSVLNHSCRPNAFVVSQGSKIMLRTVNRDCVYSDELTISYYDGFCFLDTEMRRTQLQASHFFHCKCDKCEDIELNNKKMSGRPTCCPESWFSISLRICHNCHQEVSLELADKALYAMTLLTAAISEYKEKGGGDLSVLIPDWIKIVDSCKEVLSDENTFLFNLMNVIHSSSLLTDVKVTCNYADMCLPQVMKNPHSVFTAIFLSGRQQYYEMARKTPEEMKQALNEALDVVQVVFGPEHELTQTLLRKKTFYDLGNPNTR